MSLLCLMLVSLISYATLTVATIFATAGRSSAVRQADQLTAIIGELERTYISLEAGITAKEATARGYVKPSSITILPLKPTSSFSFESSVE